MNPPRPNNLEEAQQVIDELTGTVEQLSDTVTKLQSQVAWLTRQLFGRKSERIVAQDEPGLFTELAGSEQDGDETDSASTSEDATQTVTYQRQAGRRGKRQPLPEDLPRIERIHDLPEHEKAGMKRIGEEVSEQLEIEPGKVYVVRHVRPTYARIEQIDEPGPDEPNVVTAPKPEEGLPRCLAGPTLLAMIVVSKFADHIPLYRLEGMLKRNGVHIARSSMCRWVQELAAMCRPLLALMKAQVLLSHAMRADESPVKQQMPGSGKTKQSYFYSYVGDDDHPYVLYDYQTHRSRAGPNGWFTDEQGEPLYHGYLQCDGYTGYAELFDAAHPWRMTHVGCWAHARRNFYDARMQFPAQCHHVLGRIRQLYDIEREAKDLDASQRQKRRDRKSRPIVENLLSWCEQQQSQVLPKSGLGEAITYMLNQADALRRYLDDGRLAIDNNLCERTLRGIAIGRKNWLFTGSESGGEAAAAMFSLIASARRNGLDPWRYLCDVFRRLPSTPLSEIHQFLPDRWQEPNN